jgi:DNA polymerase-3 subunit gamma/tau
MRDSQSLLEQIMATGGRTITVDDVQRLLGIAADTRLAALVEHLVARNAAGALAELDAAVRQGVDVGQLVDQLLGWLRDLLAASVGCPTGALLYVSPSRLSEVAAMGPQIGVHTLLAMLQIVEQAASRLKQTTHGRTVVELALVRICQLDELDDLATAVDRLAGGTTQAAPAARPAAVAPPPRPQPSLVAEAAALKKNGEISAERGAGNAERSDPASDSSALSLSDADAQSLWNRVVGKFTDLLADHASMAERVTASGSNRLVVGFARKYNLPKSFCERPEQLARLEQSLSAAAGGPVKVEFTLLESGADDSRNAAPRGPTPQERLREKSQLPIVRKALELFDARLVRVEDGD